LADRQTKVTLIASVNSYIADMKRAQDSTEKVGDEAAKAAAKLEKQHQAMSEVGAGIAAVGAVAAVAFGLAVARFAEFDQAMSNVQAATQESAENMGLLREAALEAGASTVFSATEAANAIEELGKAGLTTEQILGGGLAGALDLAAAGQLEVAEAAGIAAIALKQFNLEGEDVPHVADLLAAGAGKAVGDVEDLSAALGQVGLVANGAGQSIEDTTGTLAAFADAGLLGSDAGTSLKAALIALQAPTDKARKIMEEYNLSFYDTNGQMLAFDEIAGQLDENLGSLTDETRNAALAQIFGNDALRVANVLYDEGADGIRKYIDQTNDSGYAAKVAADRLDNLTGDVEKLGGAIDTALIKSGSGVNDLLRGVTQGATGIVDAIGSIPEPVLGVATQITGIVAAVGLVGGAALLAVPKIAQFKLALSTLNISGASAARGIGLATGALALAGTAFSIWAQRQAEATATASEFEESLDKTTGAVTDYTRELVAKKLAEAGAFDGAKNAGISQKELTDAILEGGDAVEELRQKLYDYANGNPFDPAIANSVNTVNDLSAGLERADKNLEDQAAAAEVSADKTTDAATAYKDAAEHAGELQSNLRELIDTINEANGIGQDAVSTNAAYQSALAGISDEVDRQKEAFVDLQKKAFQEANGTLDGFVGTLDGFVLTLDETTEAGSANAAMLADVASKAQDAALAQLEVDAATVGAEEATNIYLGTLEAQRQAFINSATEAGYNAEEVQILADKVFALPDETQVKVVADTAEATADIQELADSLAAFESSGYGLNVSGYIKSLEGRAEGGAIFGRGPRGIDSVPILAAPGEHMLTTSDVDAMGGQAGVYAFRAALHRGRLRGYANGGEIQPQYASSMPRFSSGGGSAGAGGPLAAVNVYPQQGMDEEQIGRAAARTLEFEMRSA
jgi:TP901 family phage tail tape measure protein